MKKNQIKKYIVIITALLFAFLALAIFSLVFYHHEEIRREEAILEKLYETNETAAKAYGKALFEVHSSDSDGSKSKEIWKKFGYAENSSIVLFGSSFPVISLLLVSLSCILIIAIILFIIQRFRKLYEIELKTEKKKNQLAKEELRQIPYLKKRNDDLRAFIENIAHQIKTPVSRSIMSLEMMNDSKTYDENRISECISHVEDINSLSQRLIKIGRMEAGAVVFHMDDFNLYELLNELTNEITTHEFQIETNASSDQCMFYGDKEWISEGISNLLKNCTEHDESGKPIEIQLSSTDEEYIISIRDHGEGFRDEDIPYLFDRFYLPENVKKGHVGIGMNLSKLIFEAHKGRIKALNDENGGAKFLIFLPKHRLLK